MTRALAAPFPEVGELMQLAYTDLLRVEQAKDPRAVIDLGPLDVLPRPWDVTTCTSSRELRAEVWRWLEAVVIWLNTEYVWDVGTLIPACWPLHPHLVHDLGVVADQRRRAGLGFTSDPLEDWHRYCLPAFHDRMRARSRDFCETLHRDAPGQARLARFTDVDATQQRQRWYDADLASTTPSTPTLASPTFRVIDGNLMDPRTGEIPR